LIIVCVLGFLASYLGQKLFIRIANSKNIMDVPNARSSHAVAKPRGGGLVIFLLSIALMAWSYLPEQTGYFAVLSIACALVALIGFKDDLSGASIRIRLVLHFLAAGLVSFYYVKLFFTEFTIDSLLLDDLEQLQRVPVDHCQVDHHGLGYHRGAFRVRGVGEAPR
jgi:UDP-N-acetylmuramyl pentapeptide phosphotransferase/UDP-N-acetylglucosamine-1-phosphate transferase